MKKTLATILATAVAAALLSTACTSESPAPDALAAGVGMKNSTLNALQDDTRVFKVDPQIEVRAVSFGNHYGFTLAGHLYLPQNFSATSQYPAIVISGPFGAVKEQVSGLYAQNLARQGFVTLAFDQSFTGESSGTPRHMASPDIFTEDFSAAVDFVSLLKFVDPKRIGAMGICGLSGMAVTAAVNDVRIRAVATSAMYDMSESIRDHYRGAYYSREQREKVKEHLAAMRDLEARTGTPRPGAHEIAVDESGVHTYERMWPDKLPANADTVSREFFDYYVRRAYHPRAINSAAAWDATAAQGFFNFSLLEHVEELSPRPLLIITGTAAHSRYFSENLFRKARSPREIVRVPGATHTDLYDNERLIPFARLGEFFAGSLK